MDYITLVIIAVAVWLYIVSIRFIGGPIARATWERWHNKVNTGWSRLFFPFASHSEPGVGYDGDDSTPLAHFHRLYTADKPQHDVRQKYFDLVAAFWVLRLLGCLMGLVLVSFIVLLVTIMMAISSGLPGIYRFTLRGLHWWVAGGS